MITRQEAEAMQDRVQEKARQQKIDDDFVAAGVQALSAQFAPKTPRTTLYPKETVSAIKPSKKNKNNPEYLIQAGFVKRMSERHPGIMVFSDTAAHIRKTMFQQVRANALQSKLSKDWPDVFVAQPSGEFAGLFLEFKAKSPYIASNPCQLKKSEHVENQYKTMKRLQDRGYCWQFVWSVEQAMETVEKYLGI